MLVAAMVSSLLIDFESGDSMAEEIYNVVFSTLAIALLVFIGLGLCAKWRGMWLATTPTILLKPEGLNWRPWVRTGPLSVFALFLLVVLANRTSGGMISALALTCSATIVFLVFWLDQRGVKHLFRELDRRCAGRPALARITPLGPIGIALRVLALVILCLLVFQDPDSILTLALIASIVTFSVNRKQCRSVHERVHAELAKARLSPQ